MICPYCDSVLKDTLDTPTCPRCGGSLAECVRKPTFKIPPPIGTYTFPGGYMSIGSEQITFYKNNPPKPPTCRHIPLDQIDRVAFMRAAENTENGYLCVREKKDHTLPMVVSAQGAILDETSSNVGHYANERIYSVYLFLKQYADLP